MVIASRFLDEFLYPSIVVGAVTTGFCCLFAAFAVRLSIRKSNGAGVCSAGSSLKKPCGCNCSCIDAISDGSLDLGSAAVSYLNGGDMWEIGQVMAERQTDASMMEQLVPEIRTHALSYLDFPSLCRLSMTNSLMRKAANDDNAWKTLYHKDFTIEQDGVRPMNGWKAYYAATRAVVNANAEFFNVIRENSLGAMGRLWLNADYVKCVHASGEFFSGFAAVMQSWQLAFTWDEGNEFQIRDVRARVLSDMAWLTMKVFVGNMDGGPFNITNVFEFHGERWYIVHHHRSSEVDVAGGDGAQ